MRPSYLLAGFLAAAPMAAVAQGLPSSLPFPIIVSPVSAVGACTTSTVGTTPTLILDSTANGTGRGGGGFAMPAVGANGSSVYYEWGSSAGLTPTVGGMVFALYPGGVLSFAGAPAVQLWMISTAPVTGSCFWAK